MKVGKLNLNEKGSALIVAMFFIMILTVLGLTLLFNTSLDNAVSNNYAKTVRATYTANTGIERFKAMLLYDYKHDPAGWSNKFIVVPQGSLYVDGTPAPSAALINASGSDAYYDMDPTNTVTIPSTTPYRINPNIPFATQATMFAAVAAGASSPIVIPGSGYQLMLRNIPLSKGTTCNSPSNCDPNALYVIGIGRTTATKAYLNSDSRGMNLIEDGIFGDDISVWNNIFFSTDNILSGGGNMTIHGNVHTLGPNSPVPNGTTVFATKANVENTYYIDTKTSHGAGNLVDPLKSTLSLPQQRNQSIPSDPINSLHAKFRVRNGLADISTGNAHVGTTQMPFDTIATCYSCNNNNNGFTQANPDIQANQYKNYTVPSSIANLIKVPQVGDPYKDPSTNINYPNYTDYFIGVHASGGVNYDLPGALGLKLANAIGNDTQMTFNGTLVDLVWSGCPGVNCVKDKIFEQNVRNQAGTLSQEQQVLDPVAETGETDPLFNPIVDSGDSGTGKTFMIVAVDETQNVVLVYKEVNPFTRSVDPDLTGAASAAPVNFPRVIHGFIWAPANANMGALALKVDVDGANIDGTTGDTLDWIYDTTDPCHALPTPPASCKNTLNLAESNQLVRKVTNALWRAGRGECGALGRCYTLVPKDTWEDSMKDYQTATSRVYDIVTNNLKVTKTAPEDFPSAGGNGKLIGYGAIETTDRISLGDMSFAGRFTLYTRNSNGGGLLGDILWTEGIQAISSYPYPFPAPASGATYVAFPCQNNMGLMAEHDIDDSGSPHTDLEGSFYAGHTIFLTKQHQIVGAMVAGSWDFGGGGNPDFFQAMEISRCLPPYIIAKDVIVFADSQSWLER